MMNGCKELKQTEFMAIHVGLSGQLGCLLLTWVLGRSAHNLVGLVTWNTNIVLINFWLIWSVEHQLLRAGQWPIYIFVWQLSIVLNSLSLRGSCCNLYTWIYSVSIWMTLAHDLGQVVAASEFETRPRCIFCSGSTPLLWLLRVGSCGKWTERAS